MSAITSLIEVTAPVPTTPAAGPAIPPRMRRRPLTFAALTRRATRRATWAQAEPLALPRLAFVSTVCAALTIDLAAIGVVLLAVTR